MSAQTKYRFKIDPLNRLVITEPHSVRSPLRKTYHVKGSFTMGKDNTLIWRARLREGTPLHKITFKGTWSFTSDYNLALTLDRSQTQVFGDTLVLKGDIERPDARGLSFTLRGGRTPTDQPKQVLRLRGFWQADHRNRIVFVTEQKRGQTHPLIFQGGWELGHAHSLVARYEKGRRGRASKKTLVFRGRWEINDKDRLDYRLEGRSRSIFQFKASLKSRVLKAHKDKIPYVVAMSIRRGKRIRRTVTLSGKWKLRNRLDLGFEINYGQGRIHTLRFATTFYLNRKNQIVMKLKGKKGKKLGIELVFTREFWKDGEAFLRLRRSSPETALETGVRIPF